MILLTVDVESAIDLLPKILKLVNNNCLVIDFGSTKSKLCSLVSNHPKRNQFLATHPIAGKENSGPEYAINDLFKAAEFYEHTLGCERGRESDSWIDFNLFGHQLVCHLVDSSSKEHFNPVDGDNIPVPHLSLIHI